MESGALLVVMYGSALGLVFLADYLMSRRRRLIRQRAWELAMGPPADWQPKSGERKTLFRTAGSKDLVAEILRATAAKYESAVQAANLRVEIQEFELIVRGRATVEGKMTLEFLTGPVV